MDSICSVFGCPNSQAANHDPSVYLYKFPKHNPTLDQWINLAGCSADVDINLARVCSIHFDDSCFRTEIKQLDNNVTCCTRILKYDALPSLHLPTTQLFIQNEDSNEIILLTVVPSDVEQNVASNKTLDIPAKKRPSTSKSQNTDLTKYKFDKMIETNAAMEQNLNQLKLTIQLLEKQYEEKKRALRHNNLKFVTTMNANMKSNRMKPKNHLLSRVFSERQVKALLGKKAGWTDDDVAVAITIRNLTSRRFYSYLTKTLKYPLPAFSTYQRLIQLKYKKNDNKSKK